MEISKQMMKNAIYGTAVGDALGVPYEFLKRSDINPVTIEMRGGGKHAQPLGTWSDDTSMVLATMEGLCNGNENKLFEIMNCFVRWLDGEFTIDGLFDVGITCLSAIGNFMHGKKLEECGMNGEQDNGNGALMRIMPAILYSIAKNGKADLDWIDAVGALTHAHIISRTALRIYTKIVEQIISGQHVNINLATTEVIEVFPSMQDTFKRLLSPTFNELSLEEMNGLGYVVNTLESALWSFVTTDNYTDCIKKAITVGNDTDTTAAVAGGLAGLRYGFNNIPVAWIEALRGKEIIDKMIDKFMRN